MESIDAIRSARLRLRRFEPDDAGALAEYRSDPDVARHQSWDAPFSVDQAHELIADFASRDAQPGEWFQWAIARIDAPGIVGDIGVRLSDDGKKAMFGYTIAPAFQKLGYATEIVRGLLDHLLIERGLHRVSAECDTRNVASMRLLKRLGFRREGRLRASTWSNGEWCDDFVYGLLAEEWARARVGAPTGREGDHSRWSRQWYVPLSLRL